jgi:DNA-binding protein Alba
VLDNVVSQFRLLQSEGNTKVTLKAMGRAINKAVTIAEILKRKMPLHQITVLTSTEIIDVSGWTKEEVYQMMPFLLVIPKHFLFHMHSDL